MKRIPFLVSLIFGCLLVSCQSLSHNHSRVLKKDQANQIASILRFGNTTTTLTEQNDVDEEENTFSDAQDFLAADESLPEEDEMQAVICEDSVYYNSWKEQFDENWREQNKKRYKSFSNRERALQKARADAYIQFAHPAIDKAGYDFPPVVNLQVASWIDYFTGKGRNNFIIWLRRGQELIPVLEDILDKNGLPKDLVYLAMIESGFNNRAVSIDGAVGTWQFMPYTGRQYGLTINDWVDERRDPVKATQAAARYLIDLYTKFGSWHLAAGAYNCGEGCIAKKLQKYGSDNSYFDLTKQGVINQQTANYVPKILAAMFIAKNPEKFGFEISNNRDHFTKTQVMSVDRSISLADLAEKIGVDSKVLCDLNPALRLGITPPRHILKNNPFEIVVPASKYDFAFEAIDSLAEAPQNRMVQARIKHRESLQKFARRYSLDIKALQKANTNLKKNSFLRKGQLVNVPITLGTGQYEKLFSIKRHHKKRKYSYLARRKLQERYKMSKIIKNQNKDIKNSIVQTHKIVKTKETPKKQEVKK